MTEFDPINKPAHYNQGGMEPMDYIEANNLGYCEGNVVKYVTRAKYKGSYLQDLKKARWYLDRLITKCEKDEKRDLNTDRVQLVKFAERSKNETV